MWFKVDETVVAGFGNGVEAEVEVDRKWQEFVLGSGMVTLIPFSKNGKQLTLYDELDASRTSSA